jgi:hypothetical protein
MKLSQYYIRSNIGGRCFEDVTQLAYSIASRVKEIYPINEVPDEIALAIRVAVSQAKELEKQFEHIQQLVGYEE